MIVWFTGQPGSGKTTLAYRTAKTVGRTTTHIVDGDDLRLLDNPGYDETGRRRNIDRAQAIAAYLDHKMAHHLLNVVVSLVAPYRDQREAFKEKHNVVEFYLTGPPRGKKDYWVEDYEPPLENFTWIDTGVVTVDEATRLIYRTLAAATSRP